MIGIPKKILFADDDIDDRELVEEALLQIDKDIIRIGASSGEQALTILLDFEITANLSFILLDFNMPDLTGAEVLEKIAQIPQYKIIPKIIWSTSDSSLYQNISKASGATHYFQKPQSFEMLIQLLHYMLSLS
jgi:CheY-like chemotaxis protein